MIKREVLEDTIFNTVKKSACHISPDVHSAFETAIKTEKQPISKKAFEDTLESLDRSIEREIPACGDTGWPLFFCKIGNNAEIEGGIMWLKLLTRLVDEARS